MALFPDDSESRKGYPIYSGLLQYFPAALAAIAHHSCANNPKHNAGQPMQWNRAKSGDEADAMLRHLMEGDYVGTAWRALALLQKQLEARGAPIAPAATNVPKVSAAEIAHRDGHTADGGGVIPESLAAAAIRDRVTSAVPADDDEGMEAAP